MNQELHVRRSSAEPSPTKTGAIPRESHNGCSDPCLNLIQIRIAGRAFGRKAIEARFWSKVKKSDGCWLWTASATGGNGMQHGQFVLPRTKDRRQPHVYAHRVSWVLAYGQIPTGLQVCHTCDVPRCVRPEHLFLGTQDDNMKDCSTKGRFHTPRTRTLSLADRLAIYHMPQRRGIGIELALRYRVSEVAISSIRRGHFVGSPFDRVFQRVPSRQVAVRGGVA